jgi:hypothetical protein
VLNAETAALLRSVLNEVCADVAHHATGTRVHVAVKLLEAAARGQTAVDDLRRIGRSALAEAVF